MCVIMLKGSIIILFLQVGGGASIIMPLTKTDGSPDLVSIVNHLTLLETQVVTLQTKNHDLELDVNLLKNRVERIQGIETRLNKVEVDLAVLKSQGGHLSQTVSPVKPDITNLKNDFLALQLNVSTTEGRLISEVSRLKQLATVLQNSTKRATFVRWGRTDCPVGNLVVYKGFCGGNDIGDKGSGSNILCLPDRPVYGHNRTSSTSHILGHEYEGGFFSSVSDDDDVPCVVCQSTSNSNSLMIPASNTCFPGWKREYSGIVMAAGSREPASEYVCVDDNPQANPGGHDPAAGANLYPVSSKCGALECPPYVNGIVISCAVCTN